MDYQYNFDYSAAMGDEAAAVVGGIYTTYQVISFLIGIAGYVLYAWGLCTIAKRRGISNPWLAWIPVANVWIVGSLSDQFRYVTKGQIRNKRKTLLILMGVMAVLVIALIVLTAMNVVNMMPVAMEGSEEAMVAEALSLVLWLLVGGLGIAGVSIAYAIIYYMAMYDVYTSLNPAYNVVFLVLSIIFHITEPFFVFFNRQKDLGMPPRCDIPVDPVQPQPLPPIQEPWENVTEE